jgi:phosphoesterase RecJ-like protein
MVLEEELRGVTSVGISGHVRPDGDCVGSTLAVYNYIRRYHPDIDVHIFLEEIPRIFLFLQGATQIEEHQETKKVFDLFIVLDCGDADRLGDNAVYFQQARRTLCIDHHISNASFADKNLIVADASSTSELIYGILEPDKITREIAECIYTGIIHDTGVFQYSCTARSTMEIAGQLMEKGIDYSTIVDKTFYEKTFAQNRILGMALLNSRLFARERCVATVISKAEMENFGVLPRHLEGIVNQLRLTKEADVAIFLYELEPGSYKVSTRCKGDQVDLSRLAMKYHGGGHKKAAGFSVEGSDPWELIRGIVEDIASWEG